jgi:hypothetical protein
MIAATIAPTTAPKIMKGTNLGARRTVISRRAVLGVVSSEAMSSSVPFLADVTVNANVRGAKS